MAFLKEMFNKVSFMILVLLIEFNLIYAQSMDPINGISVENIGKTFEPSVNRDNVSNSDISDWKPISNPAEDLSDLIPEALRQLPNFRRNNFHPPPQGSNFGRQQQFQRNPINLRWPPPNSRNSQAGPYINHHKRYLTPINRNRESILGRNSMQTPFTNTQTKHLNYPIGNDDSNLQLHSQDFRRNPYRRLTNSFSSRNTYSDSSDSFPTDSFASGSIRHVKERKPEIIMSGYGGTSTDRNDRLDYMDYLEESPSPNIKEGTLEAALNTLWSHKESSYSDQSTLSEIIEEEEPPVWYKTFLNEREKFKSYLKHPSLLFPSPTTRTDHQRNQLRQPPLKHQVYPSRPISPRWRSRPWAGGEMRHSIGGSVSQTNRRTTDGMVQFPRSGMGGEMHQSTGEGNSRFGDGIFQFPRPGMGGIRTTGNQKRRSARPSMFNRRSSPVIQLARRRQSKQNTMTVDKPINIAESRTGEAARSSKQRPTPAYEKFLQTNNLQSIDFDIDDVNYDYIGEYIYDYDQFDYLDNVASESVTHQDLQAMQDLQYKTDSRMDFDGAVKSVNRIIDGVSEHIPFLSSLSTMTGLPDLPALPRLDTAVTVMSFAAFSVFVANLAVNALVNASNTNTSMFVSLFGREDLNQDFLIPFLHNDVVTNFDNEEEEEEENHDGNSNNDGYQINNNDNNNNNNNPGNDDSIINNDINLDIEGFIQDQLIDLTSSMPTLTWMKDLDMTKTLLSLDHGLNVASTVYSDLNQMARLGVNSLRRKLGDILGLNKQSDNSVLLQNNLVSSSRYEDEESGHNLSVACTRRLLCHAHHYAAPRQRLQESYKLLPFWTFGVSWLTEPKKETARLLEDLRAEVAGQLGKNCSKLYNSNCPDSPMFLSLLQKLKLDFENLKNEERSKKPDERRNKQQQMMNTFHNSETIRTSKVHGGNPFVAHLQEREVTRLPWSPAPVISPNRSKALQSIEHGNNNNHNQNEESTIKVTAKSTRLEVLKGTNSAGVLIERIDDYGGGFPRHSDFT